MEDLGVGRPSTYANILQTIQDRGYVWKRGSALVPSFTAFAVVALLEEHFPPLVDYGFTASMEDDLDEIASGSEEAVPWLERFYFGGPPSTAGNGSGSKNAGGGYGLKSEIFDHLATIDAREVNSIPIGNGADGQALVARVGRYGPYVQRGDERAPIPEDLTPDELTIEKAEELLSAPSGDRELGVDPASGETIVVRSGRFGPYVQVGEVTPGQKPRTASLFKSMSPVTVSLEQALELLQLPRSVGIDESTNEEVVARNGRAMAPYLQRGNDSRSLEAEEQLFSRSRWTRQRALFAQPKQRRFGRGTTPATAEVGADPETWSDDHASPGSLRSLM